MSRLSEDPAPGTLTRCWRILGCGHRGHGRMLSRSLRIRQTGLTGGEILSARDY
jgi:hypothetical protein